MIQNPINVRKVAGSLVTIRILLNRKFTMMRISYQWKAYENTTGHDCDFAQYQNIYTFEKSCEHKDFEMAFSPGSHFISFL